MCSSDLRVAAARADVELATLALRDCALVSTAAAIVLERRVEVGTLAAAGTIGFVVGDVSSVKARFGIPDVMIHAVKPGDAIDVTVEALAGATFAGRVTAVSPIADAESRVFGVEVTIRNVDGRLRPGMIGTVAIGGGAGAASAHAPAMLTVPLTAVVRSDAGTGQFAVLVVEQQNGAQVARLRRVELGDVTGNVIAVTRGVTAGDRVIVGGATLLVDGEPVQVLQ